ncbi:signal peptidase I P [Clostridium puniceum]|uniref:Signal peptidase I n=2 Tax=Clostridium puniceum TaxID=29367 RepID=A0A1S8TFG3_9CLOT|nr:signal peptidase I P [Clostridium puniceum]
MGESENIMESKDIDAAEKSKNVSNTNNLETKEIETNKDKNSFKEFMVSTVFAKGGIFREWIIPIIAAIGIAFLINKFVVYNVYIPSESMVPTLNIGDKLVVTKTYDTSKIQRGDIIVFYSEELSEILIKRAIGLPGDHIEIHNGIVNINGEDTKEEYVKNNEKFDGIYDVPANKFFFLGDNRARSNDARRWINPYIDASDIQGRARLKFYPFDDFGILK